MIQETLFNPRSIAIIGGSQNTGKPGGKIIENLINSPFAGDLFVINPKAEKVQGLRSYPSPESAPSPDLAILAIPASFCPEVIRQLCIKGTRAFIIISAGFGEHDEKGKMLDVEILNILEEYDASLLGPNCIGMIHSNHHSVFTTPVPSQDPKGVEFISSSGSTAVFVMEAGMEIGLRFSNVYTVGNALQISVEDILAHLDESYDPVYSSPIKMIYIENIDDPKKFIRHARSLNKKGAKLIALKAGTTEAGSRAASSHTGALASPGIAVESMFKKAGVLQCYSRQELIYAAAILKSGLAAGKRLAVITHAGGAGVMMTDALEKGGLLVPEIKGAKSDELLKALYPGSSVKNPIDFLATGTSEQLALIIDHCDAHFDDIDAMAVIFGSPGLFDVKEVYDVIHQKIDECKKPIYPILPSPVNTAEAISYFMSKGRLFFPDESIFGQVLCKVYHGPSATNDPMDKQLIQEDKIRRLIDSSRDGYLKPEQVSELLSYANIPFVDEIYASNLAELEHAYTRLPKPMAMKVVGPLHKSDQGGVVLNLSSLAEASERFNRLMKIEGAEKVLLQPMLSGKEVFIGAKRENAFGHLVLFGMGGIFLEVFKDIQSLITPLSKEEIERAMLALQSYPILKGTRGQKGIKLEKYVEVIQKVSQLVCVAPEIVEMDLNPLMAGEKDVVVVDARINIGRL